MSLRRNIEDGKLYQVVAEPGDTWESIAEFTGVPLWLLCRANGVSLSAVVAKQPWVELMPGRVLQVQTLLVEDTQPPTESEETTP